MGGAAGHMAHPFDCREVRNGQDLINFYVKAVNTIPLYQGGASRDEWLSDFGGVNPTSVKFDGVNASFRLEKTNTPAGFMFVHDRGAKSDKSDIGKIDYAGITPANSSGRFKSKPFKPDIDEEGKPVCPDGAEVIEVDGEVMCFKEHGMIHVVEIMEKILNHDLMKVKPYIEALGIFENGIGPEGVVFNAEFYSNEDPGKGINSVKNVTKYNQNFIAIHNLQDFHTEETIAKSGKVTTSRKTRGYYWQAEEEINALLDQKDQLQTQGQDAGEIDALIVGKNQDLDRRRNEHQEIINKFAKALEENANALDLPFNVHTQVGLQFKEGISRELVLRRIEDALNKELSYNYKKVSENMSVGPTRINEQTGEVEPRTLKDFLLAIKQNPAHTAYYPEEFKKTKSDGSQAPATADIKVKPEFSQRHANKAGKPLATRQSAFAKKIYDDIIVTGPETGIGVADVAVDDSFEAVNSAVVLWEAVRRIGNVLKESVLSKEDFGLPMSEQEGIVIQTAKICDGIPFKFTGEFIVTGGASQFRKDAPQEVTETKIQYGKLIKEFRELPDGKDYVILIPGGFKPPTNGHYHMIKHYEKIPQIRKVFVVQGPKVRDGVTIAHSRQIFDIYGGFSDKVEFVEAPRNPGAMGHCFNLLENPEWVGQFPGATFALGASDKDEDEARIEAFFNHFATGNGVGTTEAKISTYPAAPAFEVDDEAASGTRMREAYKNGDWEIFKSLLPDESFYDDVNQLLMQIPELNQGGSVPQAQGGDLQENFLNLPSLFSLVEEVLNEDSQERISNKIAYLIGDEGKSKEQAAAIAYSMEERGELTTEEAGAWSEEPTDDKGEAELRARLQPLARRIIGDAQEEIINSVERVGQLDNLEADLIEPLSSTLATQLFSIVQSKTKSPMEMADESDTLEEMSAMGAGAVAGYAGPLRSEENEE